MRLIAVLLVALAVALILRSETARTAATPTILTKPPDAVALTATAPGSGLIDLTWTNVPGDPIVLFTFDPGTPCEAGCETVHPNTGTLELQSAPGAYLGFKVCSTSGPVQVCTNRVWITVR